MKSTTPERLAMNSDWRDKLKKQEEFYNKIREELLYNQKLKEVQQLDTKTLSKISNNCLSKEDIEDIKFYGALWLVVILSVAGVLVF